MSLSVVIVSFAGVDMVCCALKVDTVGMVIDLSGTIIVMLVVLSISMSKKIF